MFSVGVNKEQGCRMQKEALCGGQLKQHKEDEIVIIYIHMYVCMYVCKNNNLALDRAVAVETLHEPEPTNQPSDATSKSVDPTTTSTSVSQNTVNSTPTSVPKGVSATKSHKSTDSTDSNPTGQTTGITSHNVNPVAKPTKVSKEAERFIIAINL
ncbi:hypothetical protein BFJ66_g11080 [Fusarium oxysporum f. sp. cepae]|uniref:Uncharacterized protein n=1 Tax=Fusarium oxysporum f. sp. cepae TaxID=396571 RepID=A0A3L6P0S5_FUSOX|nr:hypothetical protein BFJ65_g2940 [Fusarium oxysporum f. sp. cepae]RKK41334.1 hypothetical protein BFJ66_g11080 [Fusarium oxysporum f. sp. cepae]